MGIKHFFIWYKQNFGNCIQSIDCVYKKQTFDDISVRIDTLCIDLNGVFHNAAQKIYKYGNCKPPHKRLLSKKKVSNLTLQLNFFKEVCSRIEYYLNIVRPSKRIVLCTDGVAGCAKMAQQRQRRFKSTKNPENTNDLEWDPNCLTPGTKVMDYLSKYIEWYIRANMSYNADWQHLDVIFSSEKSPGEGEHKIINYIRLYGSDSERFCIHGMDADLIMLALGTHKEHIYILRENIMSNSEMLVLDIGQFRKELQHKLRWDTQEMESELDETNKSFSHKNASFNANTAIIDFIFMCFLVGNDFLPTIPTIAILEGGIDSMIDVYKNSCKSYGHLTRVSRKGPKGSRSITFNMKSLEVFFGTIAQYEKGFLEEKMAKRDSFIEDPLLTKHTSSYFDPEVNSTKIIYNLNFEAYTQEYYNKKFPTDTLEQIQKVACWEYIRGMEWILTYYSRGIPDWEWFYPFFYGPFLRDLAKYTPSYSFEAFPTNKPIPPFMQLLAVLPPSSSNLLPAPCDRILLSETSPIKKYYPEDFEVDCAGKRKDWEGIVILPMIDLSLVEKEYNIASRHINPVDLSRNIPQPSKIFSYSERFYKPYKSFYGEIPICRAQFKLIEL